ncbi:hypothetical protein [Streptomyces sp. NPDC050856]|uniref:hypothetical protein n=1 Tax=Streptomyces sp. NPDC050856 TaxID=3154939 RepID=UPI0033F8D2D5
MRSGLLAVRAAGAAAVLLLGPAAGAAYAGDPDEPGPDKGKPLVKAMVMPATAAPGSDVDIRVTGCKGVHGTAKSKAFVAEAELSGHEGKGRPLHGDTTVKSGLPSGTYGVTVHCDGRTHHDAGNVHVTHVKPQPVPETSLSPVAPVRAGGGGAATLATGTGAGADEQGPGTPHTVIGLVLAGAAAVAVAFRSARRRRTDAAARTDTGAD